MIVSPWYHLILSHVSYISATNRTNHNYYINISSKSCLFSSNKDTNISSHTFFLHRKTNLEKHQCFESRLFSSYKDTNVSGPTFFFMQRHQYFTPCLFPHAKTPMFQVPPFLYNAKTPIFQVPLFSLYFRSYFFIQRHKYLRTSLLILRHQCFSFFVFIIIKISGPASFLY